MNHEIYEALAFDPDVLDLEFLEVPPYNKGRFSHYGHGAYQPWQPIKYLEALNRVFWSKRKSIDDPYPGEEHAVGYFDEN
jgi:hypothetical protein